MPLIKDGRIVEDSWYKAETAADLSQAGDLIVPLALWQAERARLLARNTRLGVALAAGETPEAIAADLDRLDLVALEFPKFNDGRAYSAARLLRERHGFAGELRATGNVLSDQLAFMLRCGFDAFEAADERLQQRWHEASGRYRAHYQPAGRSTRTIPALRGRSGPAPAVARADVEVAGCAGHWAY